MRMSNMNRTVVTMKLDSEDYENIYLRVREKLWQFWASLLGVLGFAGLVVAYVSISAATEKAVNRYIQTDAFKQNVVQSATAKLTDLKQRTDAIESSLNTSEKRIAGLAKLPIAIGENGIALMDQTGKKFFIESGTVKDGESVKFQNPFSSPPIIILSATGDMFGSYSARITAPPLRNANTPNVKNEGFSLRYSNSHRTYSWVAFGQ